MLLSKGFAIIILLLILKAPGCDGIPIEFLKAEGDEAIRVMTNLCNSIYKMKTWPNDWKKSIYVPIYKKGDKKECGNYRTIALISHASKILLRVLQKRLEAFLSLNYRSNKPGSEEVEELMTTYQT